MSTAAAVSLTEYLNTSYRPDCDYLDGELLERNAGEWDHSRLQMLLSRYILSPRDRLTDMQERIDDYLSFGVNYVWVIDPKTRRAYVYSAAGIHEVRDGVLTTGNPNIRV